MKKLAKREATDSLAKYVDALSTKPAFLRLIERSRRRHESRGGLSSAEMRRRLGVAGNSKRSL